MPPQSQGARRHRAAAAGSTAPCGHPTCPALQDPAHVGFPSIPLGHWTWWRGPWLPKCPAPLGDLGLLRVMAPGGLAGLGARLGRWPRAGGSWAPRHEAGWHCRLGGVAVSLSGDSAVPGGKDPSVPGMCLAVLAELTALGPRRPFGDPLSVRGSAAPPPRCLSFPSSTGSVCLARQILVPQTPWQPCPQAAGQRPQPAG